MRKGFTLIELLVVIAIIAILAAILFPVFARAREKARQTSCLSNVKEIMLAIHMYAQDYDETLLIASHWYMPDDSTRVYWYQAVQPYIQNTQILRCPSKATSAQGYGWNYQEFGYCDGDHNLTSHPHTPLGDIDYPASTILIGDNDDDTSTWNDRYLYKRNDANLPKRHNGGGNMGLCDGHAKWYSHDSLLMSRSQGAPWRY